MRSLNSKGRLHLISAFGSTLNRIRSTQYLSCEKESQLLLLRSSRTLVRELSTSVQTLQYDLKNSDITKSGNRKLFFDTHAMVQLLEGSGFTTQQAEVIVKMMVNITNSNMDVMYGDMATKTQQEIMLQKVMSHLTAVKKDMIILEKSEFSALLAENEKIKVELLQLKMQLTAQYMSQWHTQPPQTSFLPGYSSHSSFLFSAIGCDEQKACRHHFGFEYRKKSCEGDDHRI
ncbi:mitochondrial calcium uniporter regulator 1 isoform X2 [Myxocyprinus asiaticus]|uniref:mitochondrial calcium uniporter regulator 1 isoform X2 n=1 Tax=Myxocyprinus asiaticus TaxID=70543 RepID=UPI002223742F|nr:mitochondrial calcium uniporter regulator 1 isoform X2 [Myxocyprinus asiaticus]